MQRYKKKIKKKQRNKKMMKNKNERIEHRVGVNKVIEEQKIGTKGSGNAIDSNTVEGTDRKYSFQFLEEKQPPCFFPCLLMNCVKSLRVFSMFSIKKYCVLFFIEDLIMLFNNFCSRSP